jgi:hypothetical protein
MVSDSSPPMEPVYPIAWIHSHANQWLFYDYKSLVFVTCGECKPVLEKATFAGRITLVNDYLHEAAQI